ncbi:MAG: hypothetical protein Q4C77_08895 [Eubacteriales bacterium]|nr:hypothetical protein [Eubacteriales bacterium]
MSMRRKKEEQGHEIKTNMRPVRCPKCGQKIMDAKIDTKMQFITPVTDRNPDFIVRCRHCGADIGVIKTE